MVLTVIKSFVSPSKIVILIFSSALLFLSDVNSAVTNCYTCNDCKSPTNTTSTLCNSTTGEEFCFIGLKNNDLYEQGCSSSLNFDNKIYKSNGKCHFDKCNSMSLSCLSCSNCDRPATKTKAICTVNQDSCYVGIQLFGAKIDQGCFSVGEGIAQYSSSGVCKTDSCNEMKNVCYFCYQCQVPTMFQKIICTLPDSMCYVGIGKNGNYDQGCRSSSVLAESYDAYWECDTHTCNYPSLVCYHCEACKRPTTTNKTVCQFGKHDSCYIRLRKDGLYEQGCASKTSYSMKSVDNSIATIQCFENNCNKANLSCYECKNCNYTEINKQVKICTGVNETSCYTGLNYDGTYDQGCSVQNTVHLLEMYKFNSNCENSLCNFSTSIINRRVSIYYFFYLFLLVILLCFNSV